MLTGFTLTGISSELAEDPVPACGAFESIVFGTSLWTFDASILERKVGDVADSGSFPQLTQNPSLKIPPAKTRIQQIKQRNRSLFAQTRYVSEYTSIDAANYCLFYLLRT